MKTILMLLQSPFPPDIRLEKEIRALNSVGYKIVLLCNQYQKDLSPEFPNCEIIRLKAHFNSTKLNKIFNFPIFFNPRFIFETVRTYLKFNPDFIHAHDLPMVPLALLLRFLFKKPVVFDMHENYPEALKAFEKKGPFNFLFKNYKFAKILESVCVNNSDKIISVVEENQERLITLGVDKNKLIVVSNTVDLETFKLVEDKQIELDEFNNKFIILYSGTVSPERGLKTPVEAVKYLKKKIPNLLLLIIGDGKSVSSLKKIIDKQNIEGNVKLIPWVGHDNLSKYIALADICMIPQPNNDFINTTIPHKLFEYMSLSKVVLVSDAKPIKRIVEETKSGLVFQSNNPKDFANKVIEISKANISFGQNGRIAVEEKYNWKKDSKKLISLYQDLMNHY